VDWLAPDGDDVVVGVTVRDSGVDSAERVRAVADPWMSDVRGFSKNFWRRYFVNSSGWT
jgi:hypothetical protein